ncbi:unnamed protein product [Clonostachys byssicola]|uniref:Uncharacterized protein n=1 Tax=Clonostachys byssicola TaxID=160290 RepID=A0A9N9XZV3_9HYPO|nr:unnamed protein product [Clonostachys byssicola]
MSETYLCELAESTIVLMVSCQPTLRELVDSTIRKRVRNQMQTPAYIANVS